MKNILLKLFVYRDGRVSNTMFWSSVAYGVATWIIIHLTNNDKLTVDYFLAYLAVVAVHTGASKFITSKFNNVGDTSK